MEQKEEEEEEEQQQQKGRLTVDLLLLLPTTLPTTAEGSQGYCWESKTAGTERVTGIGGGLRVARLLIPPDALHGLPAVTHTADAAYDNL